MADKKPDSFKATTGFRTTIFKDGKAYKVLRHSRTSDIFVEVDLSEYDNRIFSLADKITSSPGVDLKDILRDALYDLPLELLSKIEERVNTEVAKPEPDIKTTKRERGTCINLAIGGRWAMELRE